MRSLPNSGYALEVAESRVPTFAICVVALPITSLSLKSNLLSCIRRWSTFTVAVTIVSGAVCERIRVKSYLVFTVWMSVSPISRSTHPALHKGSPCPFVQVHCCYPLCSTLGVGRRLPLSLRKDRWRQRQPPALRIARPPRLLRVRGRAHGGRYRCSDRCTRYEPHFTPPRIPWPHNVSSRLLSVFCAFGVDGIELSFISSLESPCRLQSLNSILRQVP